jgi:ribosomal protein S18 acetylase RimI-like enzyme
MELRRATGADTDAVLRLWRAADAAVSATDSAEHVRTAIEHPDVAFFVAVIDQQIVGSVLGTFDGWRGHLYRLAVHPSHRRRGIARALVRRVEEMFTAWGVTRVLAFVERDQPPALRFWEAVGYAPDDRVLRHVRMLAAE